MRVLTERRRIAHYQECLAPNTPRTHEDMLRLVSGIDPGKTWRHYLGHVGYTPSGVRIRNVVESGESLAFVSPGKLSWSSLSLSSLPSLTAYLLRLGKLHLPV
jgi:hypothetical protein